MNKFFPKNKNKKNKKFFKKTIDITNTLCYNYNVRRKGGGYPMKYYIYSKVHNQKYYYEGYLDAVGDYHKLAERLGVYSCDLYIGVELSKEYAFLNK
jgi:hypothetical protein